MRRDCVHCRAISWFAIAPLMLSLSVSVATAEIYKWVDADGEVHFGDKPLDPAQAARAKPVELGHSYQPHERTAAEQAAYDLQQRSVRLNAEERARVEKQQREAALSQRREAKTKRCQTYAAAVERYTRPRDSRVLYYLKDETGEAVSEERQQEIIEEIKANMADIGCP